MQVSKKMCELMVSSANTQGNLMICLDETIYFPGYAATKLHA